jgi:hypothetical protein
VHNRPTGRSASELQSPGSAPIKKKKKKKKKVLVRKPDHKRLLGKYSPVYERN